MSSDADDVEVSPASPDAPAAGPSNPSPALEEPVKKKRYVDGLMLAWPWPWTLAQLG